MEVNELMIGDWVYDEANKLYTKVIAITPIRVIIDPYTEGDEQGLIGSDLKGIPLTEDILKFNFKLKNNKEHFYALPCDRLALSVQFDTVYVSFEYTEGVWIDILQLNFVHQLQHFLRSIDMYDLANNLKYIK